MSNNHYAYGTGRGPVETVMRFDAVKRWHMIGTTRTQTLAEHSANVALLAYGISASVQREYFGPAHGVAIAGLLHDLAEVYTGDIPTFTKARLSGLEDMEYELLPAMFQSKMPPDIQLLMKLCDLADGIRFIRSYGVDGTARHALATVEEQLSVKFGQAQLQWPANVLDHVREWVLFYAYEVC